MREKIRILGVDPGSRLTGYGCVDLIGNRFSHVTHGTLKLASTSGRAIVPLEDRLHLIYLGLTEIIQKFKPQVMSIEKVFFAKNALSALKLGHARGAAMLTGAMHSLKIVEYAPTEVKAAVVGQGRADKEQVAQRVQLWIGKREFSTSDASDGLALAICHAQQILAFHGKNTQNRMLALQWEQRKKVKKHRMSLAECVGITAEMRTNVHLRK